MNMTFELNNLRKDSDSFSGKFTQKSPVVEIFSAMVNGQELSKFGKKADKAVAYIKELNAKADNGDFSAIADNLRSAIDDAIMSHTAEMENSAGEVLESSVASFTRCASPPDNVVLDWPSFTYPKPTSTRV